jgi:hypothetical protein
LTCRIWYSIRRFFLCHWRLRTPKIRRVARQSSLKPSQPRATRKNEKIFTATENLIPMNSLFCWSIEYDTR